MDAFNLIVLTLPGVAVTYQGEELGMVNNFDITYEETVDVSGNTYLNLSNNILDVIKTSHIFQAAIAGPTATTTRAAPAIPSALPSSGTPVTTPASPMPGSRPGSQSTPTT